MKKYFLFLLFAISFILTSCGGGGNCPPNSSVAAQPENIGTLPNGSAVYISKNNLPVSEGTAAQATIYLEGGNGNESYNVTFTPSRQLQSSLKTTIVESYGINVSTTPNPCVIGTAGSGAPIQCQVTIASSANTYDGTYLITPTATPVGGGTATILSPLTILVSGSITPSTKALTSFSLNGTAGVISGQNIAVTVPYGTNLTELVATYITTGQSVKVGNVVQSNGVTPNNFTSPVDYLVTAADGSTATYTVTVTVAQISAKSITRFSLNGTDGVISGQNIAVTMPFGTNVTALIATFTTDGTSVTVNSVAQVSTVTPNDFTSPVTYTVHAADGSTQNYTVMVTVALSPAKSITRFSLNGTDGVISGQNIAVTMPYGTNVTALVATFTTDGASVTVDGVAQVNTVTPNDFTSPVTYTVHAADGTTQNYTVTVTVETQSASITITPSTVSPAISAGGYFTLSLSLVGSVSADQTVSISNNTALQALGVLVVSNQSANLASCILNDATQNCTFNVVASGPSLANATPPDLMFSNSGSATLNPASQSYTLTTAPSFTGTIKLRQTGQTTIYTAYDDANFLIGYPWVNNASAVVTPATRFTDDDCEITDHLTGLIWLKNPSIASATTLNWDNSLTTANNGTWCGQSAGAWRVPNVNELFSLMNLGESNVADWLDGSNGSTCAGSCFNAIESTYWSSSLRSNITGNSWYITMATGKISASPQATLYWLLPVRGTSTGLASIPKTGESQTVPLNPAPAGSDGNLMKGTAWPNPRFTIGSGATADCITDNLTGLTWLRDGNLANAGATLKWESAINLASTGSWCGYTDWRMPNQIEILSLVNYASDLAWITTEGFMNLSVNQYWSSTTTAQDKSKAWTATLRHGGTNNYAKDRDNAGSLLPVRGGVGANG